MVCNEESAGSLRVFDEEWKMKTGKWKMNEMRGQDPLSPLRQAEKLNCESAGVKL